MNTFLYLSCLCVDDMQCSLTGTHHHRVSIWIHCHTGWLRGERGHQLTAGETQAPVLKMCEWIWRIRPVRKKTTDLVSWIVSSLFSHSTTLIPPSLSRPRAQVWDDVSEGALKACWMKRAGLEESSEAWRCRKLLQSSIRSRESSGRTKRKRWINGCLENNKGKCVHRYLLEAEDSCVSSAGKAKNVAGYNHWECFYEWMCSLQQNNVAHIVMHTYSRGCRFQGGGEGGLGAHRRTGSSSWREETVELPEVHSESEQKPITGGKNSKKQNLSNSSESY